MAPGRLAVGLSPFSAAGIIFNVGASMFPFILSSSLDPRAGLMVWNSSSSHLTLIMLVVMAVLLLLIVAYTTWVYRV